MPVFSFDVRDSRGRLTRGTVESQNRERAVRLLQESGYVVVSLLEQKPRWDFLGDFRRLFHRIGYERVGARDIALFTRQLSLLIEAGIPVPRALEALRAQVWESPYLNVVCTDVLNGVLEGNRLSIALSRHPRVFSETYVSLIRSGEASGSLVSMLDRLSDYIERSFRLGQKLRSALVYPALVFTISVVLVFFLAVYVFPMFVSFFEGMALRLPALTRGMIFVAKTLGNPWLILGVLACLPLVLYQAYLMSRLPHVRMGLERMVLGFPVVGRLMKQIAAARFCLTASILLECGLGQLQTLDLLADVVGSLVVGEEVETIRCNVRDGKGPLSYHLCHAQFFPSVCGHMLAAAEEAGSLPKMFYRLAGFFDEGVEDCIAQVLALIEPFMLAFMGTLVALVLLSVFQPIYALLEVL